MESVERVEFLGLAGDYRWLAATAFEVGEYDSVLIGFLLFEYVRHHPHPPSHPASAARGVDALPGPRRIHVPAA